ncbi:MAG: fibronectin type III domain-containing protein [Acidimicrobiales bacterium]
MHIGRERRGRPARAVLLASALLLGLLSVGLVSATPAGATTTNPSLFLACGYGTSVSVPGCLTLSQALSDAEEGGASSAPATIALMPGTYCPIVIPYGYRRITIAGVGLAGEPSGTVLSGPEAALSAITWDSSDCTGSPTAEIDLTAGYYLYERVTIENVAIDPGSSGPQDGVDAYNVNLYLRDDLFENATGTAASGLYYESGEDDYQLTSVYVTNDAFLDNAIGAVLNTGDGSVDDSTFSGNSTAGFVAQNGAQPYLDGDTIAENAIGVDLYGDTTEVHAENTIVGDNYPNGSSSAEDCFGNEGISGIWETGGGGEGTDNGYNLTGPTCDVGDSTDIALTDTVASPAENGGPTPSILPPSQAEGAAWVLGCSLADQREYLLSLSVSTCDIGSVQSSATGTPNVQASEPSLGFGTVDQTLSETMSFNVSNSGGNVVGTSQVSTSGSSDFSVTGDSCTDALLIADAEDSAFCSVDVTVAPTSAGALSGEVTVTTTAGPISLSLTATGGPVATVPGVPSSVDARPGDLRATITWSAPDDGGAPIEHYNVRESTNAGTSWSNAGTVSSSPATIDDLTNYTPYEFELQAVNAVGAGSWSGPSAPVTPYAPGDSTELKAPTATTINYGKGIALTTKVTDSATSKPVVGVDVSLWSRPGPSGPFNEVATATTNSSGNASISVSPKAKTRYEWQFVGSSGHDPATSSVGTVSVAQIVSVAVTKNKVAPAKATVVYGTVSPNEAGQTVALEELVSGSWHHLGKSAVIKSQTLPNGKKEVGYEISYSATKPGTYVLRVERASTATNSAGVSTSVAVTVT